MLISPFAIRIPHTLLLQFIFAIIKLCAFTFMLMFLIRSQGKPSWCGQSNCSWLITNRVVVWQLQGRIMSASKLDCQCCTSTDQVYLYLSEDQASASYQRLLCCACVALARCGGGLGFQRDGSRWIGWIDNFEEPGRQVT
jgi:hypothetical protein